MWSLSNYFKKLSTLLMNLIWPKICYGCGKFNDRYICKNCFLKYIFPNKDFKCIVCNQNSDNGLTHKECLEYTYVDQLLVFAKYQGVITKMLKDGKYSRTFDVYRELSFYLYKQFDNFIKDRSFAFVPVPLHRYKFRERGFNQAGVIAKSLSVYCQKRFLDCLERKMNTVSQTIKNRSDRFLNLLDVFTIKKFYKNSLPDKLILVDDVLTTGSTLNNCAKILKENGCKFVMALVIASER